MRSKEPTKKDLVLVLGGVPQFGPAIFTINRMYARLAENLHNAPGTTDVVLVDPEEWKFGEADGVTTHHIMDFQEFALKHPLKEFLDQYDRVAIVDDMQFGELGMRERKEVISSKAYIQLVAYADAHKGHVAWWEFFSQLQDGGGSRGSDSRTSGMREMNNIATPKGIPLKMELARTIVSIKGATNYMSFGEAPAPEDLLNKLLLK